MVHSVAIGNIATTGKGGSDIAIGYDVHADASGGSNIVIGSDCSCSGVYGSNILIGQHLHSKSKGVTILIGDSIDATGSRNIILNTGTVGPFNTNTAYSIILNASGIMPPPTVASPGFYVNPIRGAAYIQDRHKQLMYDLCSNEIVYILP